MLVKYHQFLITISMDKSIDTVEVAQRAIYEPFHPIAYQ